MLVTAGRAPRVEQPPALVKRFLDHLFVECGLAAATVTAYQRDLTEFWNHLVDLDVEPAEISMDEVRQHLIQLQQRGLALASIVRHLASIKVFLRYLFAERILRRDVATLIESPKRWRTIPTVLHYEDVQSLLTAPDARDELYIRDRALLELLYATGMRVSETVDLHVDNVNLRLGFLRCIGKGRKERVVPIGRKAIDTVSDYVQLLRPRLLGDRGGTSLFLSRTGKPLDRTNVWRMVRKHAAAAGITSRVTPHTLRHCFATHMLAGGADLRVVQELLGHADLSTTQVYTHVDEAHLKLVHRRCHPRP